MDVESYGRWEATFDRAAGIDRVEFAAPDGTIEVRSTFDHQPATLAYDHHAPRRGRARPDRQPDL
jgi:hypothetical protein